MLVWLHLDHTLGLCKGGLARAECLLEMLERLAVLHVHEVGSAEGIVYCIGILWSRGGRQASGETARECAAAEEVRLRSVVIGLGVIAARIVGRTRG